MALPLLLTRFPDGALYFHAQALSDTLGVRVDRALIERLGFPRARVLRRGSYWSVDVAQQVVDAVLSHLNDVRRNLSYVE